MARRQGVHRGVGDDAADSFLYRLPFAPVQHNEPIPDERIDRPRPVIEIFSFFDSLPRRLDRLVWVAQHPQALRLESQSTHTGSVTERILVKLRRVCRVAAGNPRVLQPFDMLSKMMTGACGR